jgi:hypothetical protein
MKLRLSPRRIVLGAVVVFLIVWGSLLPGRLALPADKFFFKDPWEYDQAAVHLVAGHFYSLDGKTPYTRREPGYSAFLALVYAAFGIENRPALLIVQGLLFLGALLLFARELAQLVSGRVATFCVLLLVLLPEVYHALLTAYREGYTLSVLLLLSALLLRLRARPSWPLALAAGVAMGVLILTYLSFLFLPLFLVPFLLLAGLRRRHIAAMVLVSYLLLAPWCLRNVAVDGHFRLIDPYRTTVMWYVRGEQAERVTGLEPFWCLWSEYISRDWTGRSSACSYNGLMHAKWPGGKELGNEDEIAREGQRKILAHFGNYLWFSVFEVLELHLPYVDGWGRTYNELAAAGMVVLYLGCLLSVRSIWRREYALFAGLVLYNTLVFVLTDATPRYLVPVIFCYAVFSAAGYASVIYRRIGSGHANQG